VESGDEEQYIVWTFIPIRMYVPYTECTLVHPVRMMRCTPLSVSTTSLIWPTSRPYVALSNGFCICPGPNQPRSPAFSCDEQSECCCASAPNVSALPLICAW
jgi:hypothetical protein